MHEFDSRLLEEKLQPLDFHRRQTFPTNQGKTPSRSTVWRWASKGVAGAGENRIYLSIIYVGRVPHTSKEAVSRFLADVTNARIIAETDEDTGSSAEEEEQLRSAGLI